MEIPIVFFTASGNTEYIATLVQKGLERHKLSIKLLPVQTLEKNPLSYDSYEILGIASPIYDFNVSHVIREWIQRMPRSSRPKKVFLITTMGGVPGGATIEAEKLLLQKNYQSIGALEIATPTFEPFMSQEHYPASWKKALLDRAYYFGLKLGYNIQQKDASYVDFRIHLPWTKFLSNFRRFEHLGWYRTGFIIKHRKEKCIQCHKCEEICPMKAIDISREKVVQTTRCMLCATCIRYCPSHALFISSRPHAIPPKKEVAPKLVRGYIDPDSYTPPQKYLYDKSYWANF